ncbi:MAG: CvpA family protein [Candidatus Cloacimonetes bacterium]|nr:CvpA family protein [Candidatus Cloacimonadota bacterium]
MEIVNILAYAIFILFAILGLKSGFLEGLLRLVGWIIALFFAFKFGPPAAHFLQNTISISSKISNLIGGVVVFIAVIILLNIFVRLLKKTVNILRLGFFDRILGIILGGFKAFILIFLITFVVQWLPINDNRKGMITDAKVIKWVSINAARILSTSGIDKTIKENEYYKKLLDEIKEKKKDIFDQIPQYPHK